MSSVVDSLHCHGIIKIFERDLHFCKKKLTCDLSIYLCNVRVYINIHAECDNVRQLLPRCIESSSQVLLQIAHGDRKSLLRLLDRSDADGQSALLNNANENSLMQ